MADRTLPGWPRGLGEELAAAYVGLSPSTFRAQIAPLIPPVRLTKGRQVWLREDLDAWLDRQAGRGDRAADRAGTPTDLAAAEWDAALSGGQGEAPLS